MVSLYMSSVAVGLTVDGAGKFVWGGNNFAHSASQIHLSLEGQEGTPWLHAQLNDRHGTTQSASVCA